MNLKCRFVHLDIEQILSDCWLCWRFALYTEVLLVEYVNPLKPSFVILLHFEFQRHRGLTFIFNFWHSGTQDWAPKCPNVGN